MDRGRKTDLLGVDPRFGRTNETPVDSEFAARDHNSKNMNFVWTQSMVGNCHKRYQQRSAAIAYRWAATIERRAAPDSRGSK